MTLILFAVLAADPNTDGFALYQKGEYAKAHELFKKAVAANPKHAFARLNHARTLAVLSKGQAPDDYCTFEKNWIHLALAELDKAAELEPKVLEKLEQADPGIDLLKKLPEYDAWHTAVTWKAGAEWPKTWHRGGAGRIAESVELDAKMKAKYQPAVKAWFFDTGKKSFRLLLLENPKDAGDFWYSGPITGDCE